MRRLRFAALATAAALAAGCGDGSSGVVTDIVIAATDTVLILGETRPLSAAAFDADGEPVPTSRLSWSSSDTSVLATTSNGRATARRFGSAVVSASSDGVTRSQVFVVGPRLEFDLVLPSLFPGDSLRVTVRQSDWNRVPLPEPFPVAWSSGGSAAAVSSEGWVTGAAPGLVDVVAVAGGATGRLELAVLNRPVLINRRLSWLLSRDTSVRGPFELWVSDPDGTNASRISAAGVDVFNHQWSRDGTRIAIWQASGALVVVDADGGGAIDAGRAGWMDWAPDGSGLVVVDSGSARVQRLDGTAAVYIEVPGRSVTEAKWSPDGRQVLLGHARGLSLARPDGSGLRTIRVTGTPGNLWWSLDGRWVAFTLYAETGPGSAALLLEVATGRMQPIYPECVEGSSCAEYGLGYGPWLADGRHLVLGKHDGWLPYDIYSGVPGATRPHPPILVWWWSPDESWVAGTAYHPAGAGVGVATVRVDGSGLAFVSPPGRYATGPQWQPTR